MRAILCLCLTAAAVYAAPGGDVKASLLRAAAAEAAGKYDHALDLYLKSYLAGERTDAVRGKIHDCFRQSAQTRRHRDPAFRKFVNDLSPSEALNLYAEIVEKLSQHYAEKDKVSADRLWALSVQEIEQALNDASFCKSHLPSVDWPLVQRFRTTLQQDWQKRQPAQIKDLRPLLLTLVRAAQDDLGAAPSAIVLEAICGACGGLDELTVYLTPQQVKDHRHEPSITQAELVDRMTGVAIITIRHFLPGTPTEFETAIQRLRMEGMRSLVLDLRDNPGGSFPAAVQIAERLIPQGLLARTKSQLPEFAERPFSSTSGMSALEMPLVVLVDGRTMSAAEVLASAVKEHNRGTLVGTATFGKGTVQSLLSLEHAGKLNVTIAKVFTASGTPLHGIGVTPHIEERDPALQLRAALQRAGEQ